MAQDPTVFRKMPSEPISQSPVLRPGLGHPNLVSLHPRQANFHMGCDIGQTCSAMQTISGRVRNCNFRIWQEGWGAGKIFTDAATGARETDPQPCGAEPERTRSTGSRAGKAG